MKRTKAELEETLKKELKANAGLMETVNRQRELLQILDETTSATWREAFEILANAIGERLR